ncbi:MAG: 50S ribosomal protein L10 [Acidimicrobiales bacterium]|nr:50S ribosomal protein L10 [Acidimicrobiales bacterium]
MENPRPEKVAVVDEVRERLSSASAALLTEYRGLDVQAMAQLRRSLREAGGEYRIYKNTLVRFAVRDLGLQGLEALLTGPTAIAFVEGDAAAVAKALRDFAKAHPSLTVKGGFLGEKVLSGVEVAALADLPPREVLLARLAGAFAAPLQQFAGLLQALPRNFAYGLQALIDQGGAGSTPAVAAGTATAVAEMPEPEAPVAVAETPEPEAPVAVAEAPESEAPEPEAPEPEAPVAEAPEPEPETPEPEAPVAEAAPDDATPEVADAPAAEAATDDAAASADAPQED